MYRASFIFKESYITYLNSIDNRNGHQTAKWLNDIVILSGKPVKSDHPLEDALDTFDHFFGASYNPRWKVAYKDLAQVVLGLFYANVWLDLVLTEKPNIKLLDLLAACALFADIDVVNGVISGHFGSNNPGNQFASWDNCLHFRDTSVKKNTPQKTYCGLVKYTDENSYANRFIKTAILNSYPIKFRGYGHRTFVDYEACHIWSNPDCPCYYSSIPNLVLLPRAIAGITDHFQPAKELFQYRSVDLFGYLPKCSITSGCRYNITIPSKPKNYSSIIWRRVF